jgi:anti-sigma factor RsiW
MKCSQIRDLLPDYTVELLDARVSARVDAHLAGCETCRGELRALEATTELVETFGTRTPPPGLFNGVRNRIEAGGRAQQSRPWWAWLYSRPARVAAMSMAMASVVLGLLMPIQNGASLPSEPDLHTGGDAVTTTALAGSIRQHAMSAGEGPLTDRVAWEAMAQLVQDQDGDGEPDAPEAPGS